MKLFTIFMLVFVLGTTAAGFSQNQLVTLDLHQCNVKQLFKEIRKQTGLRFVFNEAHVEGLAGLNIKAEAQEVKKVLDKVFGSTSLECRFEDLCRGTFPASASETGDRGTGASDR